MKPTWTGEGVELWLGDCLDIIPGLLGSFDAMIVDPPYGIQHTTSHGASWENTQIIGDGDTATRDDLLAAIDADTPAAIFGTWKTQPPTGVRGVLVWDKGPAFGMGDLSFPWKPSWELIYVRGKGWQGRRDEGVLRGHVQVSWESQGRQHPHQKPVSLLRALITKLPTAKTISDPCLGSGSTGVAAIREGRKFIGIEKDPQYFEMARRRIEAELREQRIQPKLF